MTITVDFSQSQAGVTHTKQFYESLSLEYVTEADFESQRTAMTVTVNQNGQVDTFDIGPFGDFYPSNVSAYMPGSNYIYSVSENSPFGFKIPISPAGFPDIRDFVSSSYSSYADLDADLQRYFDAWDAWDIAMNQKVFYSAEFAGQNGAYGLFTSTEPMTGLQAMILRGDLMDTDNIIKGSSFADILHGEGGNDEIRGEGGNDIIQAGSGNDIIYGGTGNDSISIENTVQGETKTVFGGADFDKVVLSGHLAGSNVSETEVAELTGPVIISAGFLNPFQQITSLGIAQITHNSGGQSVLKLAAGVGGSFHGSAGADVIDVQTADTQWQIFGGNGNDDLYGGRGNDILEGGAGADDLIATSLTSQTSGMDTLSGGLGADNYFVDNTDVIDELNNDDVLYFLSNNNIDGLLVAFDGAQTLVEVFNDTFATKEAITITSGISSKYLGASISNTPVGNSIALFRKPTTASSDQLDLWTFDPASARADLEKIWFEMNRTALKDASGELLDKSLDIHLKNGLESLTSASLQAIGRSLNIFIKVSDFFEHVVPVLQKGFRGDYKYGGEFVVDLAIGLFKVVNPFGLATFYELGKGAFNLIATSVQQGLSQILNQMEASFGQFGNGNESTTGTGAPDYFYMKGGDDSAFGLGGKDTFKGGNGTGNDLYDGGADVDLVSYASASAGVVVDLEAQTAFGPDIDADTLVSIEDVLGGSGNDTISGSSVANWIDGGSGNDTLNGREGSDTLDGGVGVDRLVGGIGDDIYYVDGVGEAQERPAEGIDTVFTSVSLTLGANIENLVLQGTSNISGAGNSLANQLTGNAGANKLFGGAGDDVLTSLAGNDTIFGGGGADRIDGGIGTDTASYDGASSGVTASLMNRSFNTGDAVGDVYYSIENLTGSSYNDLLTGNNLSNTLTGGDGGDTLIGGAGADGLVGGLGTDTASYANALAAVVAYLSSSSANTNDAAGDVYSSIENVVGSNYSDRIAGNALANVIAGGGGNDAISGNDGNDILIGGAGADRIYGGNGTDTANYNAASAAVAVNLVSPSTNTGEAAGDTFSSIENISGSRFHDRLIGDNLPNLISGGNGDDNIGGAAGRDTLRGDAGNDFLNGGLDADVLSGGSGKDSFVFATLLSSANVDTLTDFVAVDDTIRLENGIFTKITSTGVISGTEFVANISGLAADQFDRIVYETDTGRLLYDADGSGSGAAVQFAKLTAGLGLTAADFFVV
ncbi:hypothetical protein GOD68_26700 [Sinorhizobium medicae]|nr:hypothetical protein [Sinorhizobium medicae]MDX0672607.1 hypothetical protein [Sinorhizobium medicae]MDX0709856.1 hypothetical protein [Sinorhizobium medicae]